MLSSCKTLGVFRSDVKDVHPPNLLLSVYLYHVGAFYSLYYLEVLLAPPPPPPEDTLIYPHLSL